MGSWLSLPWQKIHRPTQGPAHHVNGTFINISHEHRGLQIRSISGYLTTTLCLTTPTATLHNRNCSVSMHFRYIHADAELCICNTMSICNLKINAASTLWTLENLHLNVICSDSVGAMLYRHTWGGKDKFCSYLSYFGGYSFIFICLYCINWVMAFLTVAIY